MNIEHAAAALGISKRTLQRRIKEGSIKSTRCGRVLTFTRADLGLGDPAPAAELDAAPGQPPAALEPEPEPAPTFDDESGPHLDPTLNSWSTERLEAACKEWRKPSDPSAPLSNQPAEHSSNHPSPHSFQMLAKANAILEFRRFANFSPAPIKSRPGIAFATGRLGPTRHPSSFTPQSGYGISQEQLDAESLTLELHPQFGRNRFSR